MKRIGIIDIGSNSTRSSVYECSENGHQLVHQYRILTGIVGKMGADGTLGPEGIDLVCDSLDKVTANTRGNGVEQIYVLATASLREPANADEILASVYERTGLHVEVISGDDEASLGLTSLLSDAAITSGVSADVGGGSTEIVSFDRRRLASAASLRLGTLSLSNRFGADIPLTDSVVAGIEGLIDECIEDAGIVSPSRRRTLFGLGGTSRAAADLLGALLDADSKNATFSIDSLLRLSALVNSGDENVWRLVRRICPNRVKTLPSGLMVLCRIGGLFQAAEFRLANACVREGYLLDRVLR